ncbi:MAG TPA: hypothetical protein VFR97_01340 [Capillimicrobium sp.]|nr:hypothetical protein [Capillimicrobium sp.]
MTVTLLDIRDATAAAEALAEANRRLAERERTPEDLLAFVAGVADAIAADADHELASVNPWVWIAIQSAALRAQAALPKPDPERRRDLRVAIEQMRFLFARLAERQAIGEDRPATEVARWLDATLPGISQGQKAELLGVGPRTFQRWIAERNPTRPGGEDERRLRVVARIVNQLRHSLTGPGVVDWFAHPRADLDGQRPLDALADPTRLEALLAAAAASRGNVAA